MDKETNEIKIDKVAMDGLCDKLISAGEELAGKTTANLNVGQLSGMAGVERLLIAYHSVQQIYGKLAQLAQKNGDDIKTIVKEFHDMDQSGQSS